MQRAVEPFAEQRPVRQIGQRVVARHVRNLPLRLFPFGDVLECGDPPAARHWLMHDADRTLVRAITRVTVRPARISSISSAMYWGALPSHWPAACCRCRISTALSPLRGARSRPIMTAYRSL